MMLTVFLFKVSSIQEMADKTPVPNKSPDNVKEPHIPVEVKKPAVLKKVKFTVHTYPDLQPFLEMAIVLLEGVYEHVSNLQEQ